MLITAFIEAFDIDQSLLVDVDSMINANVTM